MAQSKEQRAAFALGMAQKAGKAASGGLAVQNALKSGKAQLLAVACDAAPNTKKELYALAQAAGVPVTEVLDKDTMGHAIGKAQRTAVAVLDANFAKMLQQ